MDWLIFIMTVVAPIVRREITVTKIFTCFEYEHSITNVGLVEVVLEIDIQQINVIHLVFVLHLGDISTSNHGLTLLVFLRLVV